MKRMFESYVRIVRVVKLQRSKVWRSGSEAVQSTRSGAPALAHRAAGQAGRIVRAGPRCAIDPRTIAPQVAP